jgi:hypothetical protein
MQNRSIIDKEYKEQKFQLFKCDDKCVLPPQPWVYMRKITQWVVVVGISVARVKPELK